MKTADFDFELPPDRIALRPVRPRDSARLLVVPPPPEPFVDAAVAELGRFLRAGDLLIQRLGGMALHSPKSFYLPPFITATLSRASSSDGTDHSARC
jgi:hypothetical protein